MSNYSPQHRPTSYSEARAIVREHGKTKRGSALPTVALGYATTLAPRGAMLHDADPLDAPSYAIRYHETDIVTFYRNGVVALDHNGWTSTTTVLRWNMFTPRELRANGVDLLARRADRDPRIVVTRQRWESKVSEWTGSVYDAPVIGSEVELFVTRSNDRTTYLVETRDPATARNVWAVAPRGFVTQALEGK